MRCGPMDPFSIAMALIVLGAVFLIAEALSPGAFMLIPGAVLIVIGLIGAAFPDVLMTWISPVVAVVVAVPVTLVTIRAYSRLAKPVPPSTTVADSLVGREGAVIVPTEPGSMRGKVKIGPDIWSAVSDEPVEVGERVVVDSSEGVHVHVRKLQD